MLRRVSVVTMDMKNSTDGWEGGGFTMARKGYATSCGWGGFLGEASQPERIWYCWVDVDEGARGQDEV